MKRLPPHNNPPAHLCAFARICVRLRDTRGFMLAEQLVSVIFIGLLCVVVSAGLGAAMSAYANITMKTRADTMLTQAVELVSDELTYALDAEDGVQEDDGSELYFTSATLRSEGVLQTNEAGIWLNADSGQYLLAPTQNGLAPRLASLAYDENTGLWTFHITISSGDTVLAETTMIVKRIGS